MRYTGFHRAMWHEHRAVSHTWPIHLANLIEADRLDDLRDRYKLAGLTAPSYTALVVKAIAMAIDQLAPNYPYLNAMLANYLGFKRALAFDGISAGVAISRNDEGEDGVVQAVVQSPQDTSLLDITTQLQEFATQPVRDVERMRNCHYLFRMPSVIQRLSLWVGRNSPKLRRRYRGTFALTSVGKFGVDLQFPHAVCMLFGFGVVRERPVARDGKVIAVRSFYLSMSFDRLLVNGKPCALLMERIRDILHTADFGEELPDATADTSTSTAPTTNQALVSSECATNTAIGDQATQHQTTS